MNAVFADAFYFVARLNRHDQHHSMLSRGFTHEFGGRPVRDRLADFVPARALLRRKVRPEEQFLETDDLGPCPAAWAISPRCFSTIADLIFSSGEVAGSHKVAWINAVRTFLAIFAS